MNRLMVLVNVFVKIWKGFGCTFGIIITLENGYSIILWRTQGAVWCLSWERVTLVLWLLFLGISSGVCRSSSSPTTRRFLDVSSLYSRFTLLYLVLSLFHVGNGKENIELRCKESVSSCSLDLDYSAFDIKNGQPERVHVK